MIENDRLNKYFVLLFIVLLILMHYSSPISANGRYINDADYFSSIDDEVLIKKTEEKSSGTCSCSINVQSNYQYVVITQEKFVNNFQLLIDHKNQYLNATIVTIEEIRENFSFSAFGIYGDATNVSSGNIWIEDGKEVTTNFSRFNDDAARIRNFIRYAHQEWGTEYVLLGGDVEIIPARRFYVNLSGWYSGYVGKLPIEGWIPSDLYFGCLNGTWNDDFDEKFGEQKRHSIDEEADFYAEVYIGRAPVDSRLEVITFIDKVIHYETTQKPNNILLHQSNLLRGGVPDTRDIPEGCAKWIPEDFNIYRLYQKNEIITVEKWLNGFSNPQKLMVLHVGNGYYFDPVNSLYMLHYDFFRVVVFKNSDVCKLRNSFFPIHISISCLSGNFNYTDCIAEELLLWSDGGASACFFNSEVGCVQENDSKKYSGEFIERIFYELFTNNTENLGKINYFSKYYFSDRARNDPNYRWCYFEINLLGDPETPVMEKRDKLVPDVVFVDDEFDDSTPGWNSTHFRTIQDAIEMVPEHGLVKVSRGIYQESITISKTIDLIGEDKYDTIIETDETETVVTMRANSSTIKNFTIQHKTSTENNQNQTGVYIPEGCWGNEISNNIIANNSDYGILIQGSCRNLIQDNIILTNGNGIYVLNKTYQNTFWGKKVYVTCYNVFYHNKIISNDYYGIYLEYTFNNEIKNNTFMNNGGSNQLSRDNADAFFEVCKFNIWEGNYWNEPCAKKYIYGTKGPLFIWVLDISSGILSGIIFPIKKNIAIINIGFPSPDVDNNPAQKPYDLS